MKRLLNIFISFSLAIFIISSSVILGLKCKSLYYYDVKNLNISSMSGFSENEIKLNYDYLIDYNLNKNVGEFNLPTIKYSEEGKIHFEEVRNIFQMIKKVFYISGAISILGIIISIKNKNIKILNTTSIMTILLPIIVSIPLIINFNYFFIKFHELVFSNDYWIFDPEIDPVINILPQNVFFHIGMLILIIILGTSILLQVIYRLLNKKLKEIKNDTKIFKFIGIIFIYRNLYRLLIVFFSYINNIFKFPNNTIVVISSVRKSAICTILYAFFSISKIATTFIF